MSRQEKSYSPNRSSLKISLFFLNIFFCFSAKASDAFEWVSESCEYDCPGSWVIQEPPPWNYRKPQISITTQKQRFDIHKKTMIAEDISIVGKSMWIRANKPEVSLDITSKVWSLQGPILAWINDIYVEGQTGVYDQRQESIEIQNIEFFFQKYNLYGQAKSLFKDEEQIAITELMTTQCPPNHKSWSFHIASLVYDIKKDELVLNEPGLFIHDYQIFQTEKFSFKGLRATHPLENVPKIHLETNSGLALQFPVVWTKEEEILALVPEINSKQGVGLTSVIDKNNIQFKGFIQAIPFEETDEISWMTSVASEQRLPKFSYGYQGALISDPEFCYRYPQTLDFWEDLYFVNYAWIAKDTPVGKLTLSTEKLYRSKEARRRGYEVIEYLARADWSKNDIVRMNAGADLIHRYGDHNAYQRVRWSSEYDLGSQRGFQLRMAAYPENNNYTGALVWSAKTERYRTKAGSLEVFFVGSIANENNAPLLLDTIAQPIGTNFLTNGQWHTGLDWNSNGSWVTPRWTVNVSSELQADFSIAYALKRPSQPWTSAEQPYLTPFRDDDCFSPLSVRVFGAQWSGEILYDTTRGSFVMGEWVRSIDFEESRVDLQVFYHNYYPQDRLSQIVESVAQVGYKYHTTTAGPWHMDLNVIVDLIPIELAGAGLSLVYDDCCWTFSLKAGADKQYDPTTNNMEWHYKLGINLEIFALGMLDSAITPWAEKPSQLWRFVSKNNYGSHD